MIALPEKKPRKETETPISRKCRIAVNRLSEVRVARNNNGVIKDERGIPIRFGLGDGSPDLVGILTLHGAAGPIAIAFGLEVKQPGKTASREQRAWHEIARRRGMLTAVVTSPEEAIAAVEEFRARIEARILLVAIALTRREPLASSDQTQSACGSPSLKPR